MHPSTSIIFLIEKSQHDLLFEKDIFIFSMPPFSVVQLGQFNPKNQCMWYISQTSTNMSQSKRAHIYKSAQKNTCNDMNIHHLRRGPVGSPQGIRTCANDAVLREGHQSINSHLARCISSYFLRQKKRPKVMEHQLLFTLISSKSTRSSGEVIIRPIFFTIIFSEKNKKIRWPPQIHGRPWNPPARRLVQGLGVGQESSEPARNSRPYDQGLWKPIGETLNKAG